EAAAHALLLARVDDALQVAEQAPRQRDDDVLDDVLPQDLGDLVDVAENPVVLAPAGGHPERVEEPDDVDTPVRPFAEHGGEIAGPPSRADDQDVDAGVFLRAAALEVPPGQEAPDRDHEHEERD